MRQTYEWLICFKKSRVKRSRGHNFTAALLVRDPRAPSRLSFRVETIQVDA
jgi:hypothetical protein